MLKYILNSSLKKLLVFDVKLIYFEMNIFCILDLRYLTFFV